MTKPDILYQDQDLCFINKPAGWVVNNAETTSAPTVQQWWSETNSQPWTSDWRAQVPSDFDASYGTAEAIFSERQGIVHRLDKNTSGVLLLAAHPGSLVHLLAQFKQRSTHKSYLALVHGVFGLPEGMIDLPVGRASRDRKLFAVRPDGRPAQTKYQVQAQYQHFDAHRLYDSLLVSPTEKPNAFIKKFSIYQGFSLVRCEPLTGRTHQIRVHMAHLQHPLVGDVTYLGRKRSHLDPLWCARHFLHAGELTVLHPRTGEEITVSAPLAPDLDDALTFLSQT